MTIPAQPPDARRGCGTGSAASRRLPCLLALALLGAGCASQQAAPATSALPDADAATTPRGPCDRDHRDQAIAAARIALRQRLGAVPLQLPQAEFASLCLPPQAPGQPASAPVAGWMVSFRAGAADPAVGDDAAADSRRFTISLPEAPSPIARTQLAGAGRAEVTMASPPRPPGDAPPGDAPADAGSPGTAGPDLPGPPAAGGRGLETAPPPTVNAFAILGPDGVAGTSIRRHAVFVHVDGSITYF